MRTDFELLDPAVREAFADLVASAQGDPDAVERAGKALSRALSAFDDLLDRPRPIVRPTGDLEDLYDQLRACVLVDALSRRWDLHPTVVHRLWDRGLLRQRVDDTLRQAPVSA